MISFNLPILRRLVKNKRGFLWDTVLLVPLPRHWLTAHSHFPRLSTQPDELLTVAVNQPDSSSIAQRARQILDETRRPYFDWLNKAQARSRSVMHLEGHRAPVYTCAVKENRFVALSYGHGFNVFRMPLLNLFHLHFLSPQNNTEWRVVPVMARSESGLWKQVTWSICSSTAVGLSTPCAGATISRYNIRGMARFERTRSIQTILVLASWISSFSCLLAMMLEKYAFGMLPVGRWCTR